MSVRVGDKFSLKSLVILEDFTIYIFTITKIFTYKKKKYVVVSWTDRNGKYENTDYDMDTAELYLREGSWICLSYERRCKLEKINSL